MTLDPAVVDALAAEILAASDSARSIIPISRRVFGFGLADGYAVAAEVARQRATRGERRIGWKIGFTNRTIWDEYDVHAPIWGPMYDTTVRAVGPDVPVSVSLAPLVEPRIEPEIAFRFARSPEPKMGLPQLAACIDGVAHGCEIVQSLFPQWKFAAADTVAAFALHGRYYCGPFVAVDGAGGWQDVLERFEIALWHGPELRDRGRGANVLDGPLHALRHFIAGLAETSGERIASGEIVTTGTVTRAFSVVPGETWRSEVIGLPLPGLTLRFMGG